VRAAPSPAARREAAPVAEGHASSDPRTGSPVERCKRSRAAVSSELREAMREAARRGYAEGRRHRSERAR
jgi:hypothetical protein